MPERYEKIKSRYDTIVEGIKGKQAHYETPGIFIETLPQQATLSRDALPGWGCMGEYITIDKDKNITVTFKDGLEVQVLNGTEIHTDTLQCCRVFL